MKDGREIEALPQDEIDKICHKHRRHCGKDAKEAAGYGRKEVKEVEIEFIAGYKRREVYGGSKDRKADKSENKDALIFGDLNFIHVIVRDR